MNLCRIWMALELILEHFGTNLTTKRAPNSKENLVGNRRELLGATEVVKERSKAPKGSTEGGPSSLGFAVLKARRGTENYVSVLPLD